MQKTLTTKRHEVLIQTLRDYREKANLTQEQLAQELGEYQSFVARLESGQRRLDVIELMRLGEILSFDPAQLIGDLDRIKE